MLEQKLLSSLQFFSIYVPIILELLYNHVVSNMAEPGLTQFFENLFQHTPYDT